MFRIDIDDDGPGLDDAGMTEAVKRGRRLDESKPGTGLGLSIARTIIRAHGGEVTLLNRIEGGLLVTVTLPLETETEQEERNMS